MSPADLPASLGAAVASQRRARQLTQEQLAEAVGVSTEWISQLERGIGTPSLDMLFRLATTLAVPAAELVALAEDAGTGRRKLHDLLAVARGLPDGDLVVLLATAKALAARGTR